MKAPILKGEKIVLKPLALNQAENYVRWFKDPEVTKFISSDSHLSFVKEKKYIIKSNKNKNEIRWGIFTEKGVHVGSTGLEEIDKVRNFKASWGIVVGEKSYWGQGYGSDTLRTILRYCFDNLKLNRVELGVFSKNRSGIRCYKKCGFKKEGLLRQAVKKNGEFVDVIIMGITKSDYNKLK